MNQLAKLDSYKILTAYLKLKFILKFKVKIKLKNLNCMLLSCHFTLWKSRQNKASPLEIPQNCVTPIGISKAKSQDPWNSLYFFWVTLANSTSFCIDSRNFLIILLIYSVPPAWKFHALNLPVWVFSGIAHIASCLNWVLLNKSIALLILGVFYL